MAIARMVFLTLVLGTLGCATVQPVRDPQKFIAESSPKVLYVHHNGGAIIAVTEPRITGDTLLGVREGIARPVALPMASIDHITAVQPNKKRTTMLVAGAVVVTGAVGYMLVQGHSGDGPQCDATSRFQFDNRCR
jgi:hypothetical protein